MLKTGQEYLEGLRDGRRVYIGSELVRDVTVHPAFRNAARSFAMLYDNKRAPENIDVMSYEEDGERHSAWYLQPKSKEDLLKRMETHRRIAQWTHGLIGRSPDHVSSFVAGLAMRPDLFDANRKGFGDNLINYYKYMRNNDICACYTVLPPQGARKPELYQREGMKIPTLRVVEERDDGIVINGMKMLGTSAVFSDETWIGNLLPLGPGQEKESVTCAVPLNTEGVKIWVRKPFEKYAVSEFDNPMAYRYDETDAMVIFENVLVPWERVFTLDDVDLSREIYMRTPAHAMGNHQSNIRFLEKMKLLVGLANRVAEMNSIRHIPAVQNTLGTLAAKLSGLEAMIHGQVEAFETEHAPGYVNISRRFMYATLHWCTTNHSNICETVSELLGGGPFQFPADISVMDDPEMKETFETYWSVPGESAKDRMKILKLAWDLLGSDFAGRHMQYERFYAGPSFIVTNYNFLTADWGAWEGVVDGILDSYDVPVTAAAAE
ncbi:MAG: 4-hydroxyphenylacetate 3-hydroxylase N-terminal domain-containing protein [Rhodospirillaceae bacterium]